MLTHGGDIAGFVEEYGRAPLDFSANVSPLGLPEGVRRAVIESLDRADQYPDPLCRQLRRAIAAHEGCGPEEVLCGAGAADLIFRLALARRPKTALLPAPTFAEYETALTAAGCAVAHHLLREDEGFRLTARFLEDLSRVRPELVVLCQPNNPTGLPVSRELAVQVLRWCEENGALLLLDECFVDLMDSPETHTLRGQLGSSHLLLLRAFTKTYAMAGLRLGYCLSSDGPLLSAMAACGQPWGVSSVAQAAGVAALEEHEYLSRLRALIAEQRPKLAAGLEALGCHVYGGSANYVFFAARPGLDGLTRQKGVLIRPCANYPGLDGRFYRIAVRTEEENNTLLAVLGQCLEA